MYQLPECKPMYSQESDKLKHNINKLISGYNGWCAIVALFQRNIILNQKYEETMEEMQRYGNCGMASCMCEAIEGLL